jgi:hypothetical protein
MTNSKVGHTFIPTIHKAWWKPKTFGYAYGHESNAMLIRCLVNHFGHFFVHRTQMGFSQREPDMQQIRSGKNHPIQTRMMDRVFVEADFHRQEIAILKMIKDK